METETLNQRLAQLSADEIASLAARIRMVDHDDDVAWWRATITVNGSLRRSHHSIRSARAADAAARAVVSAGRRVGLDSAAPDVVVVATAAGDVARALVAEHPGVEPCYFFEIWEGVLELPAWAPCARPVAA